MNREQFIIPNVRKALIFGCQNSYNKDNKELSAESKKDGIKEVHSDMDKLKRFLYGDLKFDICRDFKDEQKNSHNHYDIIVEELKDLLKGVSDAGDGN